MFCGDVKDEKPSSFLKISKKAQKDQLEKLKHVKDTRDEDKVRETLTELEKAMQKEDENVMPYIIRAVEAYATLEEISNVGRRVFGEGNEPVIV